MKNKIKAFFKSKVFKKVATVGVAMCVMALSCVMCFAAEVTPETADSVVTGITDIYSGLSQTFTFANIVKFLGVAISGAGLLALGWFGLRKVVRMIQTALKKGKVSI